MTIKSFRDNPYQITFRGKIISKKTEKNRNLLVLDQTIFYPHSGGQICDKGTIFGSEVIDVQEFRGDIVHYMRDNISRREGEMVDGKIDWNTRFDHMQQHTGQHIFSAVLLEILNRETLSFHMGEDICTIDINQISFDDKVIKRLEERANEIVFENKPVYQYYTDDYNIAYSKKLKKIKEINEKLRIIEIENYDLTACGGTHCSRTGEVGIIKILKWENRKDKLRIYFICGLRALRNYNQEHKIIQNIAQITTTGTNKLEEKILQLLNDKKELNKRCNKMGRELINLEVRELEKNNSTQLNDIVFINKLFSNSGKPVSYLKQIAQMLNKKNKLSVVLATEKPEPAIFLFRSPDLLVDMNEIKREIIEKYNGHGGGSEFLAMFKFSSCNEVKKAYDKAVGLLMEIYRNDIKYKNHNTNI